MRALYISEKATAYLACYAAADLSSEGASGRLSIVTGISVGIERAIATVIKAAGNAATASRAAKLTLRTEVLSCGDIGDVKKAGNVRTQDGGARAAGKAAVLHQELG